MSGLKPRPPSCQTDSEALPPSRPQIGARGINGATMLSTEENKLLTQTDPGTPAGNYFRRFWLPALMPWELPAPDCAPVRVRLLGEDLVAFRDTGGKVGLV